MNKRLSKNRQKLFLQSMWWSFIVLLLPAAASAGKVFYNPLADPKKPQEVVAVSSIIGRFIWAFLFIGGVIAVVNIILSGMKIATAQGNQEQIKQGTKGLIWSIIGLVVMFLGFLVVGQIIERVTPAAIPGVETSAPASSDPAALPGTPGEPN